MFDRQNFSNALRDSFEALDIPAFDKGAVHARAALQRNGNATPSRPRRRRGLTIGILFLAPAIALAFTNRGTFEAFQTAIRARLHIEGVTVPIHFYESRPISLAKAKADARFRLVLPSGLPSGYAFKGVWQSQPGVYSVMYSNGVAKLVVQLQQKHPHEYVLPGSIQFESDSQGRITRETHVRPRALSVGDEVMLLTSNHLTDAQFKRIKTATGARDESPLAEGSAHRSRLQKVEDKQR